MNGQHELWLPEGHFLAEYNYWPEDPGDREHPPYTAEVSVTRFTDIHTGQTVRACQNPELAWKMSREIEDRLNEDNWEAWI